MSIIDHYGRLITPPKEGKKCWYLFLGEVKSEHTTELHIYDEVEYYATREAAEHARTRAECLLRLKTMAHGNGWLPYKRTEPFYTIDLCQDDYVTAYNGFCTYISSFPLASSILGVWFETGELANTALLTITPAEREAFLYVYQPEERG